MAIRRGVGSLAIVAAVILVVQLASVSEGRAIVDLNGLWRVDFTINYIFCPPYGCTVYDVCFVTIVQSGTGLSLSGPCDPNFDHVWLGSGGTIDPDTGVFSASILAGSALPTYSIFLQGTGTANGFSGSLTLHPPQLTTGTFTGQRCGNGQIDPGEDCDDGNLNNLDCCDATCQYETNGSPCTSDGNQCTSDLCDGAGVCEHMNLNGSCDDGKECTTNDTCSAAVCAGTAEPEGTSCTDDGDLCTGDACDAAGVCQHPPVVTCAPCLACDSSFGCVPTLDTGCKQAGRSSILLKEGSTRKLTWKWLQGDLTSVQELGDPQATTDYALCIYDGSVDQNGNPGLFLRAAAPAGSSWEPKGKGYKGFVYQSHDLLPDGIKNIRLKPGADTKPKVLVRGKGSNLDLPPLQSLVLPITVQLKAGDGLACWEAVYGTATTRDDRLFTAQSP